MQPDDVLLKAETSVCSCVLYRKNTWRVQWIK